MSTREELYTALRNADAAGDSAGAKKLAAYIQSMPNETKPEEIIAHLSGGAKTEAPKNIGRANPRTAMLEGQQDVANLGAGAVRGAGSIGATLLTPYDLAAGNTSSISNPERRAGMDNALSSLGADTNSGMYKTGKIAGEVAGTAGAGGATANLLGLSKYVPPALVEAVRTGGMAAQGAGLGTRALSGAITGSVTAGMVDPSQAPMGAAIGGGLPVVAKVAGAGGDYLANAIKNLISPLLESGQVQKASDLFKEFASNPSAAAAALKASREIVPGSQPITAAAAGDVGLSNLTRTMQNASGDFAGNLQNRTWSQNAARTQNIENIAGNKGKLATAKEARDAVTTPMRDSVLDQAGHLETRPVTEAIDMMLANPDSAGKLSQSALKGIKAQIEAASANGRINARALYAIRKDINDTLSGKLQGEAGNLRYASGELVGAKGIIDDAIEAASKRVNSGVASAENQAAPEVRNLIGNGQQQIAGPTGQVAKLQARPGEPLRLGGPESTPTGWRDYLAKYTELSKPINQMEALKEVMKRAQTGSTDNMGNLIMSGPKLNTILKNETEALSKILTPEQLQHLRNLAGDINGSIHGLTAGKAVGSNTLQNASQDSFLQALLGKSVGGSTPVKMVAGNILKIPYIRANQNILQKLSDGLLDPKAAAQLLERPEVSRNKLAELLDSSEGRKALEYLAKVAPQLANAR